jgi:putative membrane protein
MICGPSLAPSMVVPLVVVALFAILYVAVAWKQRCRGSGGWSSWRIASFMAGSTVLAISLLPQYLPFADGDFRQHMIQHILMGMLAPLGLVMAAPITLILKAVPTSYGRVITSMLRSAPVHLLANPVTALALNIGGMAVLYFTPLYFQMMTHPGLHYLVHFHFVAAGCLYTWVIAGPDPAPRRPSVPVRLVALGVGVLTHSVLAQLLYSGILVTLPIPSEQLTSAAELMYYGGDLTEMLLAFALVSTWRPSRKTEPPVWPKPNVRRLVAGFRSL